MKKARPRKSRGAAVIGLVLALFLFLLFAGLLTFDLNRAQMAQRELVALCDSASLAGTSMLATYDTSSPPPTGIPLDQAQNGALMYARNMVRRGSLLGVNLMNTSSVATSFSDLMNPLPNSAKVLCSLVNPAAGYSDVAVGDPNGRAIAVQVSYGYRPVFFTFAGLGFYTLRAQAIAGLPQVDAVMVFDFSGSMDDSTKVSFICRSWDSPSDRIRYQVVAPVSGSATLTDILNWSYATQPSGSPLNVLPPQNLLAANNPPATGNPLIFMGYLRANPVGPPPSGGGSDVGTPPGDCTMSWPQGYGGSAQPHPPAGNTTQFTDLIVNIKNPGSAPYAQPLNGADNPLSVFPLSVTFSNDPQYEADPQLRGQSFTFPSLGAVIEAARGNLDSMANFNGALLNRGNTNGWAYPAAGQIGRPWQKAYMRLASLHSQPIATALDGAQEGFFKKIDGLADTRFGLVGFSASTGLTMPPTALNCNTQYMQNDFRAPYGTWGYPNCQTRWYSDGSTASYNSMYSAPGFRMPRTPLRYSDSQTTSLSNVTNLNYHRLNATCNGLFNGRPLGQTDTAEALATARKMFNNPPGYDVATLPSSRKASRRAIIFFTDGQPTGGISSAEASATQGEATQCASQGIAIYAIGLNVTGNPVMTANQRAFLGDDTAGGICKLASNGGKFFPVSIASDVKKAFTAVARRLTQNQN